MAERRNSPVSVRLSAAERSALDELAAERGVGASTMARTLIVQALAARASGGGGGVGVRGLAAGGVGTDPSSTDPSATDPSATDPSATDPSAVDPPAPVDLVWARDGLEAAVVSALRRTLAPGLLVRDVDAPPEAAPGETERAPAKVPRGYRYADHIPYDTPDSLDDLHGPTSGVVRVRPPISTAPKPIYDLDDDGMRRSLYAAVIRDGNPRDQGDLLDRDLLLDAWARLNLPVRARAIWEAKFPELRAAGMTTDA